MILVQIMTPLGILNFLVLQWFGMRLCASYDPGEIPGRESGPITDEEAAARGGRWWSRYAPPRGVRIRWQMLRWIWPLTGWWSPFRWISAVSPYRARKPPRRDPVYGQTGEVMGYREAPPADNCRPGSGGW